jgi:hypothetical protein
VSEGHRIAEAARAAVLAKHRALDALIHIDPEEDVHAEELLMLPDRQRVLAELEAAAGPVLIEARALLHYLGGAIEVDLLFSDALSPAQLATIDSDLQQLAARRDWLRAVRVFRQSSPHG